MSALHLDTHVVVWLYAGEHHRLPGALRDRLASDSLRISPIVRLELSYLSEIGRLSAPSGRILDELQRSLGLEIDDSTFDSVVPIAESQGWTRDPFDRLIVAQALAARAPLATKDRTIRAVLGDRAVWGN